MEPDSIVGFCAGENVRTGFMVCLMDLMFSRARFAGAYVASVGGPVLNHLRNNVTRQFLETDREWLLFLDTDIVFDPEQVDALYAHDADVVTGSYVVASAKFEAEESHRALHEGAGFMLINRRAFEKIGKNRWWDYIERTDQAEDSPETMFGEDRSFFIRCRRAGLHVVHDDKIQVGHLKVMALRIGEGVQS